jgi:hypothetical protein
VNEENWQIQRHIFVVALAVRRMMHRPNVLRDDRANVTNSIIEQPSRLSINENGRRGVLYYRAGDKECMGPILRPSGPK